MSESSNDKMRQAFEEVLKQFDITLDMSLANEDEEKIERYGNYSDIVSKTQEKLDEMHEKGEEMLAKTGMTRDQLDTFASNPNNFNPEQWEALQKLKQATEDFKRQVRSIGGESTVAKSVERKPKKQQHRFGKKKDWIPL